MKLCSSCKQLNPDEALSCAGGHNLTPNTQAPDQEGSDTEIRRFFAKSMLIVGLVLMLGGFAYGCSGMESLEEKPAVRRTSSPVVTKTPVPMAISVGCTHLRAAMGDYIDGVLNHEEMRELLKEVYEKFQMAILTDNRDARRGMDLARSLLAGHTQLNSDQFVESSIALVEICEKYNY